MKKVIDIKKLANIISKSKKKTVLCHGVFDILHTGHLDHFYEAKKLADILIVSVTDDEFVKKGINRPINKIYDRIKMLSAFSIIDYVIINKDISAINTLKVLKTNFYCKGPDYKNLNEDITKNILIEKKTVEKYGGKINFTETPIKSSSKIINDHLPIYSAQQKIFLDSLKKENPKANIIKIFEDFKNLKILVIGEIILDEYIFCEALGKSGKESVLTFRNLKKEEKYLGVSLAIANNLSGFVSKIDVVRYSSHSNNFFKNKIKKNIKLRLFKKNNTNTILKTRFIDHVDNRKFMGVYDLNDSILNKKEEQILASKIKDIEKFDIVIVCDYGHGLITEKIAKFINKNSKFLCVNAQVNSSNINHHSIRKYEKMDVVIFNGLELRHEMRDRYTEITALAKKMKQNIKSKNIIVTQGKNGAFIINNKNQISNCPAFATKVIDKIGSGDTMFSILSIFLHNKNNEALSLFASSLAAAQSVETIGNSLKLDTLGLSKSIQYMIK